MDEDQLLYLLEEMMHHLPVALMASLVQPHRECLFQEV
jgi:hypothetical protein